MRKATSMESSARHGFITSWFVIEERLARGELAPRINYKEDAMTSRFALLWTTTFVVFAALSTGCARIAVSEEEELAAERFEPTPGYGSVYIAREMRSLGMLVDIGVEINGQFVGDINIGTYYLLELRPGRYTVAAYSRQASAHKAFEVLEVSEGGNYFIQVEPAPGFPFARASAAIIEPDIGRDLVIKGTGLKTPALTFREGLQFSLPVEQKWVTGNAYTIEGKYSITELVPEGETINSWSELITIQNFASASGTPAQVLDQLMAIRERLCPGSTQWNIIQKDERSILYEWRAAPCAGYPEQHEIARIIDGNWNRFRIAYTVKLGEIRAEKRNSTIQYLSEATVDIEQE